MTSIDEKTVEQPALDDDQRVPDFVTVPDAVDTADDDSVGFVDKSGNLFE